MRLVESDDQAAGLRRLLGDRSALRTVGVFGVDAGLNAMAGASLAFALAQRTAGVCVLDEAPGPRNVAGQFGLAPRHGLADVLHGRLGLDEAMLTAPAGIGLLRVEQGMRWAAETDERVWSGLADDFARTDWSWMLLGSAADPRGGFALTAQRRLLVLPASRSRLTDSYAIIKSVQQEQPEGYWQVMLVNVTDEGRAALLADTLAETTRRFLGVDIGLLGLIPRDASLETAAKSMRPVLDAAPASPAANAFREVAETMHGWPPLEAGMDVRAFWQRMGLYGRLHGRPATPPQRQPRHGRVYG